jgi:hypothetical protein
MQKLYHKGLVLSRTFLWKWGFVVFPFNLLEAREQPIRTFVKTIKKRTVIAVRFVFQRIPALFVL